MNYFNNTNKTSIIIDNKLPTAPPEKLITVKPKNDNKLPIAKIVNNYSNDIPIVSAIITNNYSDNSNDYIITSIVANNYSDNTNNNIIFTSIITDYTMSNM